MKAQINSATEFANIASCPTVLARPLSREHRQSIPTVGRTVLSAVRLWGRPILEATNQLDTHLTHAWNLGLRDPFGEEYRFIRRQEHSSDDALREIRRSSSAILLAWLSGRVLGALSPTAVLTDAEKWFTGNSTADRLLSQCLTLDQQRDVLAPLRILDTSARLLDILPYAAEVFETGNEMLFALASGRQSKKARGIYYTPSDVTDYITRHCWDVAERSAEKDPPTWIDPACGTGSFLVSALYESAARLGLSRGEEAVKFASQHLYGFDISETALQSAAFVISLACLGSKGDLSEPFADVVRRIGNNLVTMDATTVNSLEQVAVLFPGLRRGSDFLVSNPPYVWIERSHATGQAELFSASAGQAVRRGNTYTQFVKMMSWILRPDGGIGGMVTPLSISFSSRPEFEALRGSFEKGNGSWQFAHFDRTPDSLFGDDVKTRNCIVFHKRSQSSDVSIHTTDLMRWSSRKRPALFEEIGFVPIDVKIRNGIPKLGSQFASMLLKHLLTLKRPSMGYALKRVDTTDLDGAIVLACPGTAYNWLPFELLGASEALARVQLGDPLAIWRTAPGLEAATFAILHSRLAFWLWRVWGDGFHLTDDFIKGIPISPISLSKEINENLNKTGLKLWDEMQHHKIEKSNAGKRAVKYCSYTCVDQLDEIDLELSAAFGLPEGTTNYLKDFVREIIVAGRDSELATNRALTKLRS